MSCADDWWDAQTLDDLDDDEFEDIPEGPHLWLNRRWRPIEDLPDLAQYPAAA
ncbi:hypothetical protein [Kitasatospora indigofera]|uniref:hypothetical protein n=1 Tax=Kitasatospora indigofera TaxID=67307 RepID=UPI0036850535